MLYLLISTKKMDLKVSSIIFRAMWDLSHRLHHLIRLPGLKDRAVCKEEPMSEIRQLMSHQRGHLGCLTLLLRDTDSASVKCKWLCVPAEGRDKEWHRVGRCHFSPWLYICNRYKRKDNCTIMSITQEKETHIHTTPAICQGLYHRAGPDYHDKLISQDVMAHTQ